MGLDVYLKVVQPTTIYHSNITHNLGKMATAVEPSFYKALWRPEELGVTKAKELIPALRGGITRLKSDPVFFQTFNAPNGWGKYEDLIDFAERYLAACEANPEADIEVSR
jgi:hypothetical protein